MNEKISSLLDDELSTDEFASVWRKVGDEDLKTAERYQLIGALMRKDCGESAVRLCREDFASKISDKIAEEPQWLLPAMKRRARSKTDSRRPAFFGGFAAAAALAAVAVFVMSPNWTGSGTQVDSAVADKTPSSKSSPTQRDMDELNALLVEHGEFSGSAGLNGLVAYAKFVSYDSNR